MTANAAWKMAQQILLSMGFEDEAKQLLARPADCDQIIAKVGGAVNGRLGIKKAIKWCENMTVLTSQPCPEFDY